MQTPEEQRDAYQDEATIKELRWILDRLRDQLARAKEADRIDDAFYRRQNARIMVEKCLSCMGHHNYL